MSKPEYVYVASSWRNPMQPAVGAGKRTAILLEGPETPMVPELMYRMVDHIAPDVFDLLGWLGVED